MEDKEWLEALQQLEKKLARAQKRGAVLYQKSKLLEEIVDMAKRHEDDARTREHDANALIRQLITRQRELSVMLNRSNTLVARMYETNQMISLEFKEAAKALPAPQQAEIEKKVTQSMAKVEELFKKTGIPDAQTTSTPAELHDPSAVDGSMEGSFTISSDNPRRDGLWSPDRSEKPPVVHAEPVEEHPDGEYTVHPSADHGVKIPVETAVEPEILEDDGEPITTQISEERRRKWWTRFGFGQ